MPLPSDYGTGTVTGTFADTNGNPVAGTVSFTPSASRLLGTGAVILGDAVVVDLDAGGSISVTLPASNDPHVNPTDFTYRVDETFVGAVGSTYFIDVLEGTTLDLSDVAVPGVVNNGTVIYVSVLPPQAGHAGKILRTNGTDPEWTNLGRVIADAPTKTTPVGGDRFIMSDSASSGVAKRISFDDLADALAGGSPTDALIYDLSGETPGDLTLDMSAHPVDKAAALVLLPSSPSANVVTIVPPDPSLHGLIGVTFSHDGADTDVYTVQVSTFSDDVRTGTGAVWSTSLVPYAGTMVLGPDSSEAAGGAAWGGITGTLTDQTDLAAALAAKADATTTATALAPLAPLPGWAYTSVGIVETVPATAPMNSQPVLTSGRLLLVPVHLSVGMTITTLSFVSSVSAGTPTNQWFGVFSAARTALRFTVDDTTTPWAGNVTKTLALTSPYVVPSTDLYYFGIMVAAGTPPSLRAGFSTTPSLIRTINADTGLTAPPSLPFTAASGVLLDRPPQAFAS